MNKAYWKRMRYDVKSSLSQKQWKSAEDDTNSLIPKNPSDSVDI